MAALRSTQITAKWTDGMCNAFMVLAIKNVNTGDTLDMSPYFRVINKEH